MHIAVTGASGLVGSELTPLLIANGHEVTRLVRREPSDEGLIRWDPLADAFDAHPLEGVDAVVHLAGENIGQGRWNAAKKQAMCDSRIRATRTLCEGLARMATPPRTLVCASAIGYYGERGDQSMTEDCPPGKGFLAELVRDWEQASKSAEDAGIRVVILRLGVLLSTKGGALAKMLTPFQLGVGGAVGGGKQYWSWMSIDDAAGVILHALQTDQLAGPVNAVAPNAETNAAFTKTLGAVLRRPTWLPMPACLARLALGEMADELLLTSTRVLPDKLIETGYEFRYPKLEDALRHLLKRIPQ